MEETKTAKSTIDALLWELMTHKLAALQKEGAQSRLLSCDRPAIKEICITLANLSHVSKGKRASWPKDQVEKLVAAWEAAQNAEMAIAQALWAAHDRGDGISEEGQ